MPKELETLDEQVIDIEKEDAPRQVWIRVRDAEKLILPENPSLVKKVRLSL